MELAAYRKALYVKRPSKKGSFIRVLVATVIASRSSGPISYAGLVSQKKPASGSFAPLVNISASKFALNDLILQDMVHNSK